MMNLVAALFATMGQRLAGCLLIPQNPRAPGPTSPAAPQLQSGETRFQIHRSGTSSRMNDAWRITSFDLFCSLRLLDTTQTAKLMLRFSDRENVESHHGG